MASGPGVECRSARDRIGIATRELSYDTGGSAAFRRVPARLIGLRTVEGLYAALYCDKQHN
jgi:hypothetical protein